jgi:hypothetical protein
MLNARIKDTSIKKQYLSHMSKDRHNTKLYVHNDYANRGLIFEKVFDEDIEG